MSPKVRIADTDVIWDVVILGEDIHIILEAKTDQLRLTRRQAQVLASRLVSAVRRKRQEQQ